MLNKLPFEPDYGSPPDEVNGLFERGLKGAERFMALGSVERVPLLVATEAGPAWSILREAEDLPCRGRRFCEWGSGTGAVTCLAAQLGWDASGFDCEPGLVDAARMLASEEGIDARFSLGDYAAEVEGTVAADMVDPFAADLVFAYAWPAEVRWLTERFEASAAQGTVLVLYHGGVTVRAYRQS